jgi:hypothetical protein
LPPVADAWAPLVCGNLAPPPISDSGTNPSPAVARIGAWAREPAPHPPPV